MFPCNECSKLLIQAGIREIVYYEDKAAPVRDTSPNEAAPGNIRYAENCLHHLADLCHALIHCRRTKQTFWMSMPAIVASHMPLRPWTQHVKEG